MNVPDSSKPSNLSSFAYNLFDTALKLEETELEYETDADVSKILAEALLRRIGPNSSLQDVHKLIPLIRGLSDFLDFPPKQNFLNRRIEEVHKGLQNCNSIQVLAEAVEMQLTLQVSTNKNEEKAKVLYLVLQCFCQLVDKFVDEKLESLKESSEIGPCRKIDFFVAMNQFAVFSSSTKSFLDKIKCPSAELLALWKKLVEASKFCLLKSHPVGFFDSGREERDVSNEVPKLPQSLPKVDLSKNTCKSEEKQDILPPTPAKQPKKILKRDGGSADRVRKTDDYNGIVQWPSGRDFSFYHYSRNFQGNQKGQKPVEVFSQRRNSSRPRKG